MPSSSQRAYSRFIPSEEVGSVTHWKFGAMDGSDLLQAPAGDAEDEDAAREREELARQALVQQARDEAYAQGYAQGQAEAALEWQRRMDEYIANQGQQAAERLQGVMGALDTNLSALQQDMAQQMLELACDIARQVVRQEVSGNPNALLPVVREALKMLVSEGRPTVVRLNPVDLDAVAAALSEDAGAPGLRWIGEPAVAPGGCLVESSGTVIDATLGKRWARAVALLGLDSPWQEEPTDAR
ncbi:FliH/SctL family protein [Acidovorax sp.]|uniref:FliH/SctL family protein n=1 Tax=Acidovorax sp. TaxID=1872122 RepID=UPI00391F077B